eukprot:SAG31_NODE_3344_length_4381_cov_3.492760_2_plen_162_part_00
MLRRTCSSRHIGASRQDTRDHVRAVLPTGGGAGAAVATRVGRWVLALQRELERQQRFRGQTRSAAMGNGVSRPLCRRRLARRSERMALLPGRRVVCPSVCSRFKGVDDQLSRRAAAGKSSLPRGRRPAAPTAAGAPQFSDSSDTWSFKYNFSTSCVSGRYH